MEVKEMIICTIRTQRFITGFIKKWVKCPPLLQCSTDISPKNYETDVPLTSGVVSALS